MQLFGQASLRLIDLSRSPRHHRLLAVLALVAAVPIAATLHFTAGAVASAADTASAGIPASPGRPLAHARHHLQGPCQAFLPFVAGVLGMQRCRFHIWHCISGTSWVLVVVAPGYLADCGLLPPSTGRFDPLATSLALLLLSIAVPLVIATAFA
jgi:hypothetical protein